LFLSSKALRQRIAVQHPHIQRRIHGRLLECLKWQ
jgi:hypothetical protein